MARAAFSAQSEDQSEGVDLAERKLGFLKRTGLFGNDLKGCAIARACTAEDLRQAYRLVHDVFLARGYIAPEPSGMRVRIFETTPEMATFVAKVDGRVVGVISILEDSADLGLPSDGVFKAELDALRRTGRRLCEATNQAVADEYRKSAVPTELMRCAVGASVASGNDEIIAAVSPSHNGFYELLGFRQIGTERSYSARIDDPVIAVSMETEQYRSPKTGLDVTAQFMRNFFAEENQFLSYVTEWAHEARRCFLSPDLLRELFVFEKDFVPTCAERELEILARRWGSDTFAAVTADLIEEGELPHAYRTIKSLIQKIAAASKRSASSLPQRDRFNIPHIAQAA